MKSTEDLVQAFNQGRVSRREFVERAGTGSLSLFATLSALDAHAQAGQTQSKLKAHHSRSEHGLLRNKNQTNVNPFEEWLKQEDIPVYRDYSVPNLRRVQVKPWKRLGAGGVRGAHIDLIGSEGLNSGYVCELAPGASSTPQRYLFEEVLYILSGEGETTISTPSGRKQSVKWKAGAVLAPPLNVWRQHFNRGKTPVRFFSITNAPVIIDLFHNADFVFNNDYVFRDRYNGDPNFFGAEKDKIHHKETTPEESEQARGVDTWDGGFVPNVRELALYESRERGSGNSRIELQLSDNSLQAHVSEFEVGTYKKAHRHGPGSHVVMLNGRGYTLMWKGALKYSEAKEHQRIDWTEGSLFVPPDGWFHQHFNAGDEPARYLAPTWGGDGKWFMRALGGGGRTHRLGKTSTRKGGNLIEYEDEDPAIREIYVAELKKSGLKMRMPSKGEEK